MTTTDSDFIRRAVARTYAGIAGKYSSSVRVAGYTSQQLAAVPDGVAESFVGCGNPLSFVAVRPGDTVLDLGSGAPAPAVSASVRSVC